MYNLYSILIYHFSLSTAFISPFYLPNFKNCDALTVQVQITQRSILGDPGAGSGDEGKSKRAEKYSAKKSKEWREEPLGTMSYETSSKRSPPFCLLIGARKTQVFRHQSEARTAAKGGC